MLFICYDRVIHYDLELSSHSVIKIPNETVDQARGDINTIWFLAVEYLKGRRSMRYRLGYIRQCYVRNPPDE